MKVLPIAALALLCLTAAPLRADDDHNHDAGCDGSTQAMVECLGAKTRDWDLRLNVAYQKLMKQAQDKQRDQLRMAQRQWVQYRDANCMFYALGEGTISRIDAAECMRSMTQARALELETAGER